MVRLSEETLDGWGHPPVSELMDVSILLYIMSFKIAHKQKKSLHESN